MAALDFPNTPTTGQNFTASNGSVWTWDGAKWIGSVNLVPGPAALLGYQVFTSSGTYTPTPGMASCLIECVGGGAGGNGTIAAPANVYVQAAGGGSGGYSRKYATAAQIGASQVVTVGAGGTGGPAGSATYGTAGSDTSVGTLCIAHGAPALPGGTGGWGVPGLGAPIGVGDLTTRGMSGMAGAESYTNTTFTMGGGGGSSVFGGGGPNLFYTQTGTGPAGAQYGGGGTGGLAFSSGQNAGGAGSAGIVIIAEYGSGQGPPGPQGPAGNPGGPTFLDGGGLSNDPTSPLTVLDIARVSCADSIGTTFFSGATITKTTAIWSAGNGGGGMAIAVAASTWYHVFAAMISGVYDVFFDTSITAANKPTGTTAFRRLGSIKTDASSHILPFIQSLDYFYWITPLLDVNVTTQTNVAVTYSVSTPPGVACMWLGTVGAYNATNTCTVRLYNPSTADLTSALAAAGSYLGNTIVGSTGTRIWAPTMVLTNASAQLRAIASEAESAFFIVTSGWIDFRGKQ